MYLIIINYQIQHQIWITGIIRARKPVTEVEAAIRTTNEAEVIEVVGQTVEVATDIKVIAMHMRMAKTATNSDEVEAEAVAVGAAAVEIKTKIVIIHHKITSNKPTNNQSKKSSTKLPRCPLMTGSRCCKEAGRQTLISRFKNKRKKKKPKKRRRNYKKKRRRIRKRKNSRN